MNTYQVNVAVFVVGVIVCLIIINILYRSKYGKPVSKTCDIITQLNTYTDVKCNTVIFYNDELIEFKYHDGQTITVSAYGTNIKFK